VNLPPLAERALEIKRLHDLGYTFTESATIESLSPRQRELLALAAHAETYIEQQSQQQEQAAQQHDTGRPGSFGDVAASRREVFS
jgi:hypothetical protein